MIPCDACSRFVRSDAPRCPSCDAALRDGTASATIGTDTGSASSETVPSSGR